MFHYACNKNGFKDIHEYIIDRKKYHENIEKITFTDIKFEIDASIKGFENQQKFINLIPEWQANLDYINNEINSGHYDLHIIQLKNNMKNNFQMNILQNYMINQYDIKIKLDS